MEKLKIEYNKVLYYFTPTIFAIFGVFFLMLTVFGAIASLYGSNSSGEGDLWLIFGVFGIPCLLLFSGLLHAWLSDICKDFHVTESVLHIEEGILSKKIINIPLQKINDIQIKKSLLQRILNGADMVFLTGNDNQCKTLKDIENAEMIREKIFALLKEDKQSRVS